ncbi:MAG: twitch domain-containing radical SAM protein [Chitinophagales bacterium]|nr:twitch domain-containing radical SAM protein [Chitinophagales bacterium]MDW8418403.1 twitch domain-containing radical SAM protein [Chitinophagales bacterium]
MIFRKLLFKFLDAIPALRYFLLQVGWKNSLLKKSKYFCMAPFIQLHAQTNGNVAPCCMADSWDGRETGNLNEDANLLSQWNSPKMRQLRRNMLAGKSSPICGNCYKYENIGKVSERMNYNRDYAKIAHRILLTDASGYLHTPDILLLDLRFSNKCNYKCRICNSDYSSLWYEEEIVAGHPYGNTPVKEKKITGREDEMWESLRNLLPRVERIHFAGGEPLFMDEHYRILDLLLEVGHTEVTLSYNTNFSTLRYKNYNLTEMWKHFKCVDVWASLDGMGAKGDYQRKGQRWNKIEENIREIQRECPNILFGVNVTVSVFNIMDITDFYQYMIHNRFVQPERMNLYLLFGPECFSITQLPKHLKDHAAGKIQTFIQSTLPTIPLSEHFRNHLESVVKYMYSAEPDRQTELRTRIKSIDALRNENFANIYPELAELVI